MATEDAGRDAKTSEVDARTQEPDGDAAPREDASSRDAAEDPARDAAGCADGDRDDVCDAEDNCPQLANEDQADADQDGVGDACAPAAVNCEGGSVGNTIDNVSITRITINGTDGASARVAPGADVTLALEFSFANCGIAIGAPEQVYVALAGQEPGCESRLCVANAKQTAEFRFKAPSTQGGHQVTAATARLLVCDPTGITPVPALTSRIATICVVP